MNKISKHIILILIALGFASITNAQSLLKVCSNDLEHKYTVREVEHKREFIQLFDQYCKFLTKFPNIRLDANNVPIEGKHEDYYESGKLLHKGNYQAGVLLDFTNYYDDGSKERMLKLKKDKPVFFESYFSSGKIMQGARFTGVNLVSRTKFTINEYKRYIEERESNGTLKELSKFNDYKLLLEKIELIDGGKRLYKITKNYLTGELKEEGEYKHIPETNSFDLHGLRVKYTKRGAELSRKEYKDGSLTNTLEETDAYQGKMPKEFRYFDRDKNDDIAKSELDWAVNAFFSDDPKVTFKSLTNLVNYFFEQ